MIMSPLRVKFIGTPVITYVRRYAPPLLILASSLIAGCGGLSAPAEGPRASLAAGPASRAPVSVNSPLSPAAEIRGQKIDGPAPLASDAPRVGPPAAGQVVAEDYRIGPQDLIEVQVYGLEGLKREVRVNSRGVISLPLIGTYGNVSRGSLIGPGLTTFDTSLFKKFRINERWNLQFRAEAFNLFNHSNFSSPNAVVFSGVNYATSAGRITSTATTSRQIQFALKLSF